MRMASAPTPASPWAKTGRSSLSPASDARGKACASSRKAGCGATSMASSPPSRTPKWPPCTRRRCRCAWSRPTSWTWDAGRGEDVAAAAGDGVLAVLIVARTMSPIDPYRPLECPLSDVRFAPPFPPLRLRRCIPKSGRLAGGCSCHDVPWLIAMVGRREPFGSAPDSGSRHSSVWRRPGLAGGTARGTRAD